ncbi:aldose 1-epimerase [Streptacidiphilus sp. ASG 303]|uniref:aldose epimerase family protein n=1 Tax=Streptacidiphilus sp. ASG 303 TaxID=2896847 RepID=UPI001E3EF9AD|nr:aldose 1-epimerase [Streptacidiphilus sp. ASG 303]MCD0485372.1 aldose 1-epimerase [Streptacidiphilus sp. ASG 303]
MTSAAADLLPDTPSAVRLTAGEAALTVLPDAGCRLGSLRIGGLELLRRPPAEPDAAPSDRLFGWGSFPMVPWAGRVDRGVFNNGPVRHRLPTDVLPPHAIHGTALTGAWRLAAPPTDREAVFVHDLADPWPYPGRVTQRFVLGPDELRTTLEVETRGDSFPAQVGWHPWFLRHPLGAPEGSRPLQVDFAPAWQEERGADHLPTGRRIEPQPGPWDDCFGMPDGVRAVLDWPGLLRMTVTSDCRWAVVFDQLGDALCFEPQSGPPNGLNTRPRLVTPIDPLEAETVWRWERP